jgi:hypothetical protein
MVVCQLQRVLGTLTMALWNHATRRVARDTHGGANLADDDATSLDNLTAQHLDTPALCIGVAAVLGRTGTLLVCSLNGQGGPRHKGRASPGGQSTLNGQHCCTLEQL